MRRTVLIALAIVLLLAGAGAVAILMSNDFVCSTAERRAMTEFAHYNNAVPAWESNAKITGGCTTTFTVDADLGMVLTYYQDQLSRHGWTVQPPSPRTVPIFLEAEREGLRYHLMFEGPTASSEFDVQPGQIRVTISGGHRR